MGILTSDPDRGAVNATDAFGHHQLRRLLNNGAEACEPAVDGAAHNICEDVGVSVRLIGSLGLEFRVYIRCDVELTVRRPHSDVAPTEGLRLGLRQKFWLAEYDAIVSEYDLAYPKLLTRLKPFKHAKQYRDATDPPKSRRDFCEDLLAARAHLALA